jgi:hypothetical protein
MDTNVYWGEKGTTNDTDCYATVTPLKRDVVTSEGEG